MVALVRRAIVPLGWFLAVLVGAFCLGAQFQANPFSITYVAPEGAREFIQHVAMEVGAAILITLFVREAVEHAYERRQAKAEAEAETRSIQRAARAVFGSFYSDETIAEAMNSIFDSPLIRERLHIKYVFEPDARTDRLLNLRIITTYTVRNVSGFKVVFEPGVSLANFMAYYPQDPAATKPVIESVKIDKTLYTPAQLATLNRRIKADDPDPTVSFGSENLKAGQTKEISVEVVTPKLINDTEVMRMRFPTKNAIIVVENQCGASLRIDIKGVHRLMAWDRVHERANGTSWGWEPSCTFLPNNGWVLYWNDLSVMPSGLAP